MPIVSSSIVTNHQKSPTRLRIHEQHICAHGDPYYNRYSCNLDYDVDSALAATALRYNSMLISGEEELIINAIEGGTDPQDLNLKHLTTVQKYKQIIKGMMSGRAVNLIKAAELIGGFTDEQIQGYFTVEQTTRIRDRINYILDNKVVLESENREVLE